MRIVKDFILREITDEYILIPTGNTTEEFNGLITLSETGAFIWNHLEQAESFDALLEMIIAEYEIDKKTAAQDAYELLNQMLNVGMIALTDPSKSW